MILAPALLSAVTLAETMITTAHARGIEVIAEAVETMKQLEISARAALRLRAGILSRAPRTGGGHNRAAAGAGRKYGHPVARHGLISGRFDRSVTGFAKLRQL
jgi:hypothetical protein